MRIVFFDVFLGGFFFSLKILSPELTHTVGQIQLQKTHLLPVYPLRLIN